MLRVMGENGAVRVVADQIGTPTAADSLAGVLWALVANPDIRACSTSPMPAWPAGMTSRWPLPRRERAGAVAARGPGVAHCDADYPTPARRPAYSVLDKRR